MTKQEIALQLTLKILETSNILYSNSNNYDNLKLLEKKAKIQSELTSNIFNDLISKLNCE